jgi:hypothetical protein
MAAFITSPTSSTTLPFALTNEAGSIDSKYLEKSITFAISAIWGYYILQACIDN